MQQALDFNPKALRDDGTQAALNRAGFAWHDRAVDLCLEFFARKGSEGALFEDVREYATSQGLPDPPSGNAWGAVCLSLSRKKLIVRTGRLLPSRRSSNHARAAAVWRLAALEGCA